jgi:hypothetical protein
MDTFISWNEALVIKYETSNQSSTRCYDSLHVWNNVGDQLDATVMIYWCTTSSTYFGQFLPIFRIDRQYFYSLWFSAPKLLPGCGPESLRADCLFGVKGAS